MTEPVTYYRPSEPNKTLLQEYAKKIAESKMVTNGPLCRELEDRMREMHGATFALCCSNGTTGLALALQALRRLTGARTVYLPAFTWSSSEWAAVAARLNRSFVDIDPKTWNMLPTGEETEICMPVSVFGAGLDFKKYRGHILVDAAHAVGTKLDLSKVAGAIYSLAPSKLLTAGEGGVLLTNDSKLATEFSELRRMYARLSELNAALALSHWSGISSVLRDRRLRWDKYRSLLGTPQQFEVSNYSTAAFLLDDRDVIRDKMAELGVETRAYYKPLVEGAKNADSVYQHVLCLPNWYGCPTDTVLKALEETLATVLKPDQEGT